MTAKFHRFLRPLIAVCPSHAQIIITTSPSVPHFKSRLVGLSLSSTTYPATSFPNRSPSRNARDASYSAFIITPLVFVPGAGAPVSLRYAAINRPPRTPDASNNASYSTSARTHVSIHFVAHFLHELCTVCAFESQTLNFTTRALPLPGSAAQRRLVFYNSRRTDRFVERNNLTWLINNPPTSVRFRSRAQPASGRN